MPDGWLVSVLAFLGIVATAVLTFLGTRLAARLTARAAERATEVTSRQVAVEEWRGIIADLRIEVDRLKTDVADLKRDRETDHALIEELREDRRDLLSFARSLLAWASFFAPDHYPPPPPTKFVDELT